MTDDEMQALREVAGCGWPMDDDHDNHPKVGQCCNAASRDLYGPCKYCGRTDHRRAYRHGDCDTCLRLLADAVVRQRVERIPREFYHELPDGSLSNVHVRLGGVLVSQMDLLAALTGENA